MRYLRLFLFVAILIGIAGALPLHAQKKDTWEAVYVNGRVLAPIRSIEGNSDSILAILPGQRTTAAGDSYLIHRYYKPVLIPLDSLVEVRSVRSSYVAEGALIGFLAGGLAPLAIQGGTIDESFYAGIGIGTLLGAIVTGIEGMDDVYTFDPLTPEERRILIDTSLMRATPGELAVRTIDSVWAAEKPEPEHEGRRKGILWFGAGLGPARWTRLAEGERNLASVPRFSFGIESQDVLLSGSVTITHTSIAQRTVVDLLVGKPFASDYASISLSAGPSFVSSTPMWPPDRDVTSLQERMEMEPTFGFTLASDATLILFDSWGLSATGYSTFSRSGWLFGCAFSTKFGMLR